MRLPLASNLESRDGLVSKDAKVLNGLVESRGEAAPPVVRKRPGLSYIGQVDTGVSQMIADFYGLNVIIDDTVSRGTLSAIVSSPTTSALSPSVADMLMSHAKTSEGAGTPRLMFKNRTNGWVMTRAGAVSTVTYGASMGSQTHNLVSLTRASTTLTATTTDDTGLGVGDSVTIAGADQSDYNGTYTVTGVTEGSYTPARIIPITITRSGTTATATTVSGDHGLTTATAYTIAGANETAYNGSKTITTAGGSTFTYTVTVTTGTAVTWNPSDKGAYVTLSGGDLVATINVPYPQNGGLVRATEARSSHKWYWEVTISGTNSFQIGLSNSSLSVNSSVGDSASSWSFFWNGTNSYKYSGGSALAYGSSVASGDVIGVAWDAGAGTLTFYINGVSQGQAFSNVLGTLYPAISCGSGGGAEEFTANFGASAFAYSAPSGYVAFQSDAPYSPATGTITVTDPAVTVSPTFTYTKSSAQATPATGTITAAITGGTVPGITYINGYFNVMDVNGNIYSSALDDPTSWTATDVVVAQHEPGVGVALAKSGNYMIALKEWSSEFFYDAKNATGSPFSPVENGFTLVGCANGWSCAPAGSAILWVAQSREHLGRSVYMMAGLEQRRVSTPDVERIINEDDLATVYALGLNVDGHDIYILTLVSSAITLVYDIAGDIWYQWSHLTIESSVSVLFITRSGTAATVTTATAHGLEDGDPVKISGATQEEYNGYFQAFVTSTTTFEIVVAETGATPATGTILAYPYTESYFPFIANTSFQGYDLLLHASNGGLYAIDINGAQDAGAPINFFIRTQRIDGGANARKKLASVGLVGDTVSDTAAIRWSDNDCSTYVAYRPIDLSLDDPTLRRCGAFRRRTFEVRHVGDGFPVFEALEMEPGR